MEDLSFIQKKRIYTISITAIIFVLLFSITIFSILKDSLPTKEQIFNTETIENIDLSTIEEPNYEIPKISIDTDLEKFPTDYDNIVSTLKLSLTQHQKMSLLIYGETECKSIQKNIQEGYLQLLEKDIPILIPEQYLKTYIEQEINSYLTQLREIPMQLQDTQCEVSPTFNTPYQRYIWEEMAKTKMYDRTLENDTSTKVPLEITNFYLDLSSELVNETLYKLRILNALSEKIDTTPLSNFLNDILIYNQDIADINARGRISKVLEILISNIGTEMDNNMYWEISVIKGVSYLNPTYLSKEFPVDDNNFNIDYEVAPIEQLRNSIRVPILMYHHIKPAPAGSSEFTSGLYVSPEIFEEQLAYLVKKNYKTLSSEEFYNLLSTGKNPSQKSLMLTFDDATFGQYLNGFPLLKKYGLTGIFYIPSNKTAISYNQLREMATSGMVIESHSATHIDLAKESSPERLYSEIVGSRYALMGATGQPVITISYPGCVADSETYKYVSQAGYLLGTSCGKSIDHYFKNRLSLSRVHVFNSLENFINLLSGKQ